MKNSNIKEVREAYEKEKKQKLKNKFRDFGGSKEVWKILKQEKKIRKILKEHKSKLPVELIEKILLWNRQHPVAKIVRQLIIAFEIPKKRFNLEFFCTPDFIRETCICGSRF